MLNIDNILAYELTDNYGLKKQKHPSYRGSSGIGKKPL